MSDTSSSSSASIERMRDTKLARARYHLLLPLLIFIALIAVFAVGLTRDPTKLPSALIGKPVPTFELSAVQGRELGLSSSDLVGEVSLVNVFASWCTACRVEHPIFMRLHADGTVPLYGLNYKDKPAHAARWLETLGDPYTRTGADLNGRVGIEWGVYGIPETFVIAKDGRIAFKHVGPITETVLEREILPLVTKLRSER